MSFAETFSELRKRRRLPTTAWEPDTPSPYVHDVEKKGLIPGPEKLDQLAAVFVQVAREQGAAEPEDDARLLARERERAFYIERGKLDPELADVYVSVYQLMGETRAEGERDELLGAVRCIAETLYALEPEPRQEFMENLRRMVGEFQGRAHPKTNGDHREATATH